MLKGYKKFDMKNIMATTKMTDDELNGLYKEVKQELGYNNENLDAIFNIALLDKEKLFPNQNKKTEKECLMRWVERYKNCMENLPSQHIGTPKNTCTDPSLAKIVKASCEYSDEEIEEYEKNHNLFMAAENIQGGLLEEYIARNVASYDWIWCAGETLSSVDFCKRDGSALLQVKNKDNTENSSSNKIRTGTEIKKTNRLRTRYKDRKPYADYEWNKMNDIINENLEEGCVPCTMSEQAYQEFLDDVVKKNPKIISAE